MGAWGIKALERDEGWMYWTSSKMNMYRSIR